ncbi:bifunctional phosphopantothenoylcysteine decarboxylase/phosphopantothenate--cysteine ligase CoaBC [Aphanothece sacrum]|uniref:Coenzyme A biosynthesis bifunctional protein CoaBC n=1 Tax=Aphanothece sacrum FPU1 TaxID=1920663 RepID=A0A401IM48_APHSA|nr:bifunctional phosphopantothenoylcysteine decarboxylase/phosphopantothenate--cysteine ligase CoaBC [Aphanothece sacrum]GBF82332.1 phosphopantothenoylcysteine decarboxylase/phosphopantothenate--cysteine ligase [Aphanothece sacrum FPU1]GBF84232.1 bifunctional phosphopantothenoylcysteine decarboxylase/phosphopantothenate--cysteine ligase [Aphanothece sacrum FPU3]
MLNQQNILIGMGGGIAAYKVCEVISSLFQQGVNVRVILTNTAQQFITPLTVSTLSRHQAYTDADFWQPIHSRPLHIELGEWANLFLIAPLTANTLGKLTSGLADNLLTNTVLASNCPILLAPAMNTDMWEQPTVQRNWQQLQEYSRYHTIGPGAGLLACDRVGSGRMAEPSEIITKLQSLLYTKGQQDFQGKRILISAGGTREYLDPVRFIGNPATGKMGLALAQASRDRGAVVTLIHGPIASELLPTPSNYRRIPVVSAGQMEKEMLTHFSEADIIIMSAAVADVKPAQYSQVKLPKNTLPKSLELESVSDIIAQLGKIKEPHQCLIGFAAQTGDIVTPAIDKLKRKQLDIIVANPVDQNNAGFGSDNNQAIFIHAKGQQKKIDSCSKLELAHQLLDFVAKIR